MRVAKFTVIPGGGREREPPGVLQARRHFRQLIVELLRAIARGDDYESRVARELLEFTDHAVASKAPLRTIIDPVLADLQKRIAPEQKDITSHYMRQISDIVFASLQVAAEVGCTDGFAKARLSGRTSALEADIKEYIVEHERRSRENKWSFLSNLLQKHFPIRPKPRRPRKPPVIL